MRRIPVPLRRLGLRLAYRLLQVYWALARPVKRGAKCVITRGDEVLLVRHTYGPRGRWELPGGGVRRRERPSEAARREIEEELGVVISAWRPLGDLYARINRKRDTLCCFHAEVDELDLDLDRGEIAEASWFPAARLPARVERHVPRILALRDAR